MTTLANLRSSLLASPWRSIAIALACGAVAGFAIPQDANERRRLEPVGTWLTRAVRRFADRSIVTGLGRR